jgi:hypothetical protein
MSLFRKAQRRKAKLRLAIDGPSGSGKTFSSLLIARGLADDWSKIAVIDTERGSGDLYTGAQIPGTADRIGEYLIVTMEPPYSPRAYCELVWAAEKEDVDVLIIDSLSHAWSGEGGALDMVDRAAKASRSQNSFAAWRDVTPHHNKLVDTLLSAPFHVIVTMRTKTAYELQENEKGKKVPVKIGLAPEQRSGVEYEFTTVLDLSVDGHVATAGKDRTTLFAGEPHIPGVGTGKRLREWLDAGVDPLLPARNALAGAETEQDAMAIAAEYKAQAKREGWINDLHALFEERLHEISAASADSEQGAVASPADAATSSDDQSGGVA